MNHKRFSSKFKVPYWAMATLLAFGIGLAWLTSTVQAQSAPTITTSSGETVEIAPAPAPTSLNPDPWLFAAPEYRYWLDKSYGVGFYGNTWVLKVDTDAARFYQNGEPSNVAWPLKPEETSNVFIVEHRQRLQNGTGTVFYLNTSNKCWYAFQVDTGSPDGPKLLSVDDQGGINSPLLCEGDEPKRLLRGEGMWTHNGLWLEVGQDGHAYLYKDDVLVFTSNDSGTSTCAWWYSGKITEGLYRNGYYPGHEMTLVEPAYLLIGNTGQTELLNRMSAIGKVPDQCNTEESTATPTPTATATLTATATTQPTATPTATPVQPPPSASCIIYLPLVKVGIKVDCAILIGFGENQPSEWYEDGEEYPTQPDRTDIWVKLNEQFDTEGANTVILSGSYTPWEQGKPVVSLGERYIMPDEAIKFVNDARPGTYQINLILRWYNPLRDKVICFVIVKIDDPDPGLPTPTPDPQ